MFAALARITNPAASTVAEMLDSYLTHGTADLAPQTLEGYRRKKPALVTVFGSMSPDEIQPNQVAQFLELRKKQNKSVAGNREMALLSSAFSYAMRNGFCARNPCYGVRRNKEKPRSRYVTDDEFTAACERASEPLRRLMLFAYLTGWRQGDCIALDWESVSDEGISLTESKTGKKLRVSWSDELREIVGKGEGKVFLNSRGRPWTSSGVQSAMQRLKVDWTFHDLRAKAESDHASGLGLMALYRRARVVTPVR